MPSFGAESPFARGNLGGEDGAASWKDGLVSQNKVRHFMVGLEAIASRLYHSICEISLEGIYLHMQVTDNLI